MQGSDRAKPLLDGEECEGPHHDAIFPMMDGQNAVSEEHVREALEGVIDPELGLDFVTLGLIYGIAIRGGDVEVVFSLTAPGCPIGPQVAMQDDRVVGALDGVRSVTPRLVFQPPWSRERLSEDARFALGL